MKFIKIAETFNSADIDIIKSIFEGENITYRLEGENTNAVLPLVQPVKILVAENQVEPATDLLKDMHSNFFGVTYD